MGRRELFKSAAEELKKEKDNKFSRDFEERHLVALKPDNPLVVRIWGEPIHVRTLDSSPIYINWSNIVDDEGSQFRCIWSTSKDWLLWKIYNTVLKYDWIEETKTKIYHLATTFPELVSRVSKNNRDSKFENGWKVNKYTLMNVLDRSNMEWHKEHKHWKILSRNLNIVEKNGESKYYYDLGYPAGTYEMILNSVVEDKGDWEDYDIAIERFSAEVANNWYSVKSFHDKRKLSEDLQELMSDKPLTEEEKSWEKYNLTEIIKPTSYKTIHNRLGKFIAEVDKKLGTSFTEMLQTEMAKEREAWDAERKIREANEAANPKAKDEPKQQAKEQPKEEAKEQPKERSRKPATSEAKEFKDFWEEAKSAGWAVDELSDEDKKLIKNIKVSTGEVEYLDEDGNPDKDTIKCEVCETQNSFNITTCPKCSCRYS